MESSEKDLRVLSLFSGCGGMDLGFEGGFICHRKSVPASTDWVKEAINDDWVRLRSTRFRTVFANDILVDARVAWLEFMKNFGYDESVYHLESIVDLVKKHRAGKKVFPKHIDIVTGGFPCQDFSLAGMRRGFNSTRNHDGTNRETDEPSEETRGKLYFWMKQVIDIVKPSIFVAENVKGLVNFGDIKNIIQRDFSHAAGDGYIVLDPQVLHAGNYGVPEARERVIFIGIKKKALKKRALRALEQQQIPDEYNPYPKPTHACTFTDEALLPPIVCGDVFKGLDEPDVTTDLSQRHYSSAKYLGTHCQGQKEISLRHIAPTIRSEHHGNIEFRRLSAEHGGINTEELVAGLKERRLTPRECALIQTFPPDYPFIRYKNANGTRFYLSPSNAYRVIGNAVPPVLAYHIARRIQALWPIYFK